jgi:hypothetical protein
MTRNIRADGYKLRGNGVEGEPLAIPPAPPALAPTKTASASESDLILRARKQESDRVRKLRNAEGQVRRTATRIKRLQTVLKKWQRRVKLFSRPSRNAALAAQPLPEIPVLPPAREERIAAGFRKLPLKRIYQALNKRYFGGHMPAAKITWETDMPSNVYGRCWSDKNGVFTAKAGGWSKKSHKVVIALNLRLLSKQPHHFLCTLVHEMIHGYLGGVWDDHDRHGAEFKRQYARIYKAGCKELRHDGRYLLEEGNA